MATIYLVKGYLDVAATTLADAKELLAALADPSTAANSATIARVIDKLETLVQSDSGEPLTISSIDDTAGTISSWVTDSNTTLAFAVGDADPTGSRLYAFTSDFTIASSTRTATLILNTAPLAAALTGSFGKPGRGISSQFSAQIRKTNASGFTETVGLLPITVVPGVITQTPIALEAAAISAYVAACAASAATATAQAEIATTGGTTATTQAGIATTQAGLAATARDAADADAVATAADRVQTGLDRASATASATAAASSAASIALPLSTASGGLGANNSASTGVPLFASGVNTFTATIGSGNIVRATSPTITTPTISTVTSTAGAALVLATGTSGTAATIASASNAVTLASTTTTSSTTTGALVVGGGVGVAGAVYTGTFISAGTYIGNNGAVSSSVGVNGTYAGGGNANVTQFYSNPTITSGVTGSYAAFRASTTTQAAAFTVANVRGLSVDTPTIGAGSAITTNTGISISNQGATGVTNAYGIDIAAQSGAATTNVGLRNAATTILSGDVQLAKTVTAGGTTGAQTINKSTGTVNFAAAAGSLVVTNSLVTTSSIIICTVGTNDTTCKSVQAVAASGSFTLFPNAAPTAETRVNFLVTN